MQRLQAAESGFAGAVREDQMWRGVEGAVREGRVVGEVARRKGGGVLHSGYQRALEGPEVRKDTWNP